MTTEHLHRDLLAIKYETALRAILARQQGRMQDPALNGFFPLPYGNMVDDMAHIAEVTLGLDQKAHSDRKVAGIN